jgi:uncharacterized membrane protein HdeD (DUF308 family)
MDLLAMTSKPTLDQMERLDMFWWAFAIRGGFAVLFAGMLAFSGNLLGSLFFDPVMLVLLSILLGFYVFGNALLLGVSAGFAFERHLGVGWLLASESCFGFLLGAYISFSLLITSHSLALLAGIHAVGAGCFQIVLALKLHRYKRFRMLLGISALIALSVGILFLTHQAESPRLISLLLSGFELTYGLIVLAFAWALHAEAQQGQTPTA